MRKNKIAWAGALVLIGIITTEFGIIGILDDLAKYYDISIHIAGYLLSGFAMIVALAGPIVTLYTGKFNRKVLMIIGLLLFLTTAVVSFFSPPFWVLLLVRFLPAFLHPTLISIAVYAATSNAAPKYQHQMMSIVIGGIAIATVTTIPLTTYISGLVNSWQASFVLQAIVTITALLGIIFIYPSMPAREAKSIGNQLKIFKNPVFIWSSFTFFFMNASMFATYGYFANYMKEALNYDTETTGILLFIFGITGVIGNFLTGKLLSKNVTNTTAFFLIGLLLISFLLVFLPYQHSLVLVYTTIVLWGFFHTPGFVNGQAYMIEAAPESQEFANSLSISFGNLGISIGTYISGLVITLYGVNTSPWIMLSFGVGAVICMIFREKSTRLKPANNYSDL